MSRIQPKETLAVRERILAATKEGRLQDWNERIGEIAVLAGTDLSNVNWNKCPTYVAADVIDHANRMDDIESVLDAITKYEASHPS